MAIDLAYRAYSHTFKMDPIVRSLMDNDVYKLFMHQLVWKLHNRVKVEFTITNRAKSVKLANIIPIEELKAQLDHARTLKFLAKELIWLQGQTFYGVKGIFEPQYIEYLRTYQLPEYVLTRTEHGQYELSFPGLWQDTTLWEIHAIKIVNTLRNRYMTKYFSRFDFDILYSRAKVKLWDKLNTLSKLEDLNVIDFGTRRCWDFLWQEWAVLAAKEVLGSNFTGTSNMLLAMEHSLEARGTNAHELPMVYAAMTNTDEELKHSQYQVLEDWKQMYQGNMLVALPDTFGTTQFLRDAPDWFWTEFKGCRWDSKPPIIAGEEYINGLNYRDIDPMTKLGIASDGLDANSIATIYHHFNKRLRTGNGWGTLLTNDFRDCHPHGKDQDIKPISLVCKATWVQAPHMDQPRATVKLSDNYEKAMGADSNEVARYQQVFGSLGMSNTPVVV